MTTQPTTTDRPERGPLEWLDDDASIIEQYLDDWERRKPKLRGSHMMIFFREHVRLLNGRDSKGERLRADLAIAERARSFAFTADELAEVCAFSHMDPVEVAGVAALVVLKIVNPGAALTTGAPPEVRVQGVDYNPTFGYVDGGDDA